MGARRCSRAAGREAATATGDLLFSRAFAELAHPGGEEPVRALSTASSALARGELVQRADAWDAAVTAERYRERCRLKTSSLFEASARLGALFGGRADLAGGLGRFGGRIGLAFQMLDDVLDVSGPFERTGKPRGTDLLDGTVTLPLILARRHDAELAALDLRATVTGPEEAAAVCDRIAATGALDEAREAGTDRGGGGEGGAGGARSDGRARARPGAGGRWRGRAVCLDAAVLARPTLGLRSSRRPVS